MRAADIMTSPLVSIKPDAPIVEAVELMMKHGISGLPVVDGGGKLVGMLTEGDLLRRAETGTQQQRPRWLEMLIGPGRLAEEYSRAHGRKVEDVMTRKPFTVSEDAPLAEIVQLMERRRIKRLPVMRGEQAVGIVSRANLVRALPGVMREIKPGDVTDVEIRERIMTALRKEPWAPIASIDVTVRNGIVDIWGTILDGRERKALIVAVENVPGVKAVHDHLAWIEPTSGMIIEAAQSTEAAPKRP